MNGDGSGDEPDAEVQPDLADVRSTLRRLKQEGCNLLVVGDPPREVFTRASATLLGDPDARRWRVFALTDATPGSVADRLPATATIRQWPSETTRVVNFPVPPRPITDSGRAGASPVPVVTVKEATVDGLRAELDATVAEFGAHCTRPGAVRVAVDSLAPLLDHYDVGTVREFVRSVGERVRASAAMAHYVLPTSYDGERCRRLEDEFDAVVELRTAPGPADHDAEERWHLPGANATTPWVPL